MNPLCLRLSGISLATDPFYWPLLSGLTATFIMYFLSTVAHTFQSRSEIAHYVFFMCDYAGKSRMTWVTLMKLVKSGLICYIFMFCIYLANFISGIGVYGMASGVLHFIYCSCDDFYNACGSFFVPGCIFTGVLACAGNCLSKVMFQKPYPKVRVFWQVS